MARWRSTPTTRSPALKVDTFANLGAYMSLFSSSIPTYLYATLLSGQYDIPTIYGKVLSVYTNTAPVDAYRGAGRPEATYLIERLMETAARRLKVDPAALRRSNFVTQFPHQTPVIIAFQAVMEQARAALVDRPLVVLVLTYVSMWAFARLGGWLARRRLVDLELEGRSVFGVVSTATLTVLALIIGFTFSMALSRYDERKNLEEAEANAIGTELARADLLLSTARRCGRCYATMSTNASLDTSSAPNARQRNRMRGWSRCRTSCGPPSPRRRRRNAIPSARWCSPA